MNRLGGDVIRKIAHFLEILDSDKDVVHITLTCKRLHRYLQDDLARLKRIYCLSDYSNWSRKKFMVKRAKSSILEHVSDNLLPPGYQVSFYRHEYDQRQSQWLISISCNSKWWEFRCGFMRIDVIGESDFCTIWINTDYSIDWTCRGNQDAAVYYPQFENVISPILKVYRQLMDALWVHAQR
jgi:hypothetical protein